MKQSFSIVRETHRSLVHPIRHGVRLLAVILAISFGSAGQFLEHNRSLKELDIGNVVEQIHAVLERREFIKELQHFNVRG